jgi:hypothetical protein
MLKSRKMSIFIYICNFECIFLVCIFYNKMDLGCKVLYKTGSPEMNWMHVRELNCAKASQVAFQNCNCATYLPRYILEILTKLCSKNVLACYDFKYFIPPPPQSFILPLFHIHLSAWQNCHYIINFHIKWTHNSALGLGERSLW